MSQRANPVEGTNLVSNGGSTSMVIHARSIKRAVEPPLSTSRGKWDGPSLRRWPGVSDPGDVEDFKRLPAGANAGLCRSLQV